MTIPAGYRQCKACDKQFKKWSTKDTANYCPSCNQSRLTRHETVDVVNDRLRISYPEEYQKRVKKQERKTAENKEYWEEQEKRKDPDYPSMKERNKKHYTGTIPKSFEDARNKKPNWQRTKKRRRNK